jgi:hypothetical protein
VTWSVSSPFFFLFCLFVFHTFSWQVVLQSNKANKPTTTFVKATLTTMATRDATRSNGGQYRNQNDCEPHHIREHDSAPEWGNCFTCVACWQHNIPDLTCHRNQHCEDWNALNRINCGFQRQYNEGRAPNDPYTGFYPDKPYVLTGEHYRMVKGRYGISPHHIMRWQNENYGPYDPLESPPGVHVIWTGITFWNILVETLNSLPPSIAEVPLQCTCLRALQRARNGTTHSYFHEKNALDELFCQNAVGNFMGAHPPLIGHYQNLTGVAWNTTQPFLARHSQQPLGRQGVWVDLATQGVGICGVGHCGIAESNVTHFLAYQAATMAGFGGPQMNLYQGKTVHDARRGNFSMPGTPRH